MLTPKQLSDVMQVVLRVGKLMLSSGTASFRVEQVMGRVALGLGVDRLEASVSLNSIIVTLHSGHSCCTQMTRIKRLGINGDRLGAIEHLSLHLPVPSTPATIATALNQIEHRPHLYSIPSIGLMVGLACGAFGVLNGGGIIEFTAATLGATLGQITRTCLLRKALNQIMVTVIAATIATSLYYLAMRGLAQVGWAHPDHEAGFLAAVLFLVPGMPLVTAALDLARLDLLAGISRIAYGLMILLGGAVGVWMVILITGLTIAEGGAPPTSSLSFVSLWVLRSAMSFLAALGFAVLYNIPQRALGVCGAIGMVGNGLRLLLRDGGLIPDMATFFGALLVGLVSVVPAHRLKLPLIVFAIPGIICMIPGVPAYETMVYFNQGDILAALASALRAGFLLGAIATGLGTARILTDWEWALEAKD